MDGVHQYEQKALDPDAPEVRAVTVPGLFVTARELLSSKPFHPGLDLEVSVEFDDEWGFPKRMSSASFTNCYDCVWGSSVQKFLPFDSAAPPPTPTPRK
jgi:hypothetical protein